MIIRFLGTNGWHDTETGNTLSILIQTENEFVILDAGNGLYKIIRYIKGKKPIYLFLSHFHLDHIIGLHTLAKFNFSQGISIYGPKGMKKVFDTVINSPYSIPIHRLKTKIRLYELNKRSPLPIKVKFKKLKHSSFCYGYRFNLEGKTISYCPDTGICTNLLTLAKSTDLLITECSYRPGERNKEWPHLNPQDSALVAKRAKAKRMVLVHFDPSRYKTFTERSAAGKIARKIFKNTLIARDLMSINL